MQGNDVGLKESGLREKRFAEALKTWGFMLMSINWVNSIMVSALATRACDDKLARSRGKVSEGFKRKRAQMMTKSLTEVWVEFTSEFGKAQGDEQARLETLALIRHQLCHLWISSGREFGLFMPRGSGTRLLRAVERTSAMRVRTEEIGMPEMLIIREGDYEWINSNLELAYQFMEKSVLERTRRHGIQDSEIG